MVLCRRYRDNRAGAVPDDALSRAAAEYIQDVAMACGGHANEIDLELDGHVDDRVHDVARPQHHLWRASCACSPRRYRWSRSPDMNEVQHDLRPRKQPAQESSSLDGLVRTRREIDRNQCAPELDLAGNLTDEAARTRRNKQRGCGR